MKPSHSQSQLSSLLGVNEPPVLERGSQNAQVRALAAKHKVLARSHSVNFTNPPGRLSADHANEPNRSERRRSGRHHFPGPHLTGPEVQLPHAPHARRGKLTALTNWVRVWSDGESGSLQVDKSQLTTSLGVQPRDFRLFESQLAARACGILSRDKAIIVNIAYVRAIITTHYALFTPPSDDRSMAFLSRFKERVQQPAMVGRSLHTFVDPSGRQGGAAAGAGAEELLDDAQQLSGMDLTFELRALEICLDELASDFESRAKELEGMIKPAIERLAASVRFENLDQMRRLKGRLVSLTALLQTVCVALEELLEDEKDMLEMNLSAKEQREIGLLQRVSVAISECSEEEMSDSSSDSSAMSVEVSKVEMLLEAYFMHFDSISDRLQDLMENVTDTEAMVNIQLDAHQNRLLSTDLVATCINTITLAMTGISGYLSMNLTPDEGTPLTDVWGSDEEMDENGEATSLFHSVVLGTSICFLFLFVLLMVFLVRKGIVRF